MSLVRIGIERLLLVLYALARTVFLFQAVAFGCASLATFAATPADPPAWLREVWIAALLLATTFGSAGLLLAFAGRWRASQRSVGAPTDRAWPRLLGLSLLMLPALAAHAGAKLLPLWGEIATQLTAVGFWDGLARNDPYGGIVLLPILLALCVPALVTAAALCSIATPLVLLPLLATRSQRFPTLLAMGVICQAALVLSGWLAADAFARLAAQAGAAMAASGDAEVLQVEEQLRHAADSLSATAAALVVPLLGMLAWTAFLRPSGTAAGYFSVGSSAAPNAAPRPIDAARSAQQPPASTPPLPASPPARVRLARLGLALLGVLLLGFAGADALRTRPVFVSAQPEPGATLAETPAAVQVRLAAALDPASALSITRLVSGPADGTQPHAVEVTHRIAASDPTARTLEAVAPSLPAGLYRVAWTALPAGGGVPRHGSYSFGVGVPVPPDTSGVTHSLLDRDAGARSRRHTLAGGVLLLAMGALLPRFAPRR